MATQIPESIRHSDLTEALRPLHDLLGITSREVYLNGFTITSGYGGDLAHVTLFVAARRDGDTGERPAGVKEAEGLQPAPVPHAELAWACGVRVV